MMHLGTASHQRHLARVNASLHPAAVKPTKATAYSQRRFKRTMPVLTENSIRTKVELVRRSNFLCPD